MKLIVLTVVMMLVGCGKDAPTQPAPVATERPCLPPTCARALIVRDANGQLTIKPIQPPQTNDQ